jgi:type II secretory pathway component GspD/PulD (secretin)
MMRCERAVRTTDEDFLSIPFTRIQTMKRIFGGLLLASVAAAGVALAQDSEPQRDGPRRGFREPPDRGGIERRERPAFPGRESPLGGLLGGRATPEPGPAGKAVSFSLVIVEVNKAGKQKPVIDLSSAEKIPDVIRTLEEKGELSVMSRVRLASLEQMPCSVQIGEQRPVATGRSAAFPSGRGGGSERVAGQMSYQMTNVGTMVQITSRVEDDGAVIAELNLSASRLTPAGKPEEDGEILPQRTTTMSTQSTVRIPKDQGVIVSGSQTMDGDESRETLIVVSAHVDSSPSAASARATSAEDKVATDKAAEAEVILRTYALQNASADDTAKLLLAVANFPIQATADPRTNQLIVRAPSEGQNEVEAILRKLDEPKPAK